MEGSFSLRFLTCLLSVRFLTCLLSVRKNCLLHKVNTSCPYLHHDLVPSSFVPCPSLSPSQSSLVWYFTRKRLEHVQDNYCVIYAHSEVKYEAAFLVASRDHIGVSTSMSKTPCNTEIQSEQHLRTQLPNALFCLEDILLRVSTTKITR